MTSEKQKASYRRLVRQDWQKTLGHPEGEGYIGNCPRCDDPVLFAYVDGLKQMLSTKSVPYRDAAVLVKYYTLVYHVWRANDLLKTVSFVVTHWIPKLNDPYKPKRGTLHMHHYCRVRP